MNKDGHLFGAFLFNLVYWIIATENSLAGLLASCILACCGGLLPDVLEPPTWPGHRGVFHYVVGPISILPAIFLINSNLILFAGGAFCFGYFSHFVLDVV
jgi:hypothetical protein